MYRLLLLLLVIVSTTSVARQIDVVAGWNKPPYVDTNTDSGFELELTKHILSRLGHTVKLIYVPFGRSLRQLEQGRADIVLTVNPRHKISRNFLTDEYVTYQNTAISLASRNLQIDAVKDLSQYTVLAFQTAQNVLGAEFTEMVSEHKGYLEIADQSRQVRMLLMGSVDVAVMDQNIFSWLRSKLPAAHQKEIRMHPLFGKTSYRAAVADESLRNAFNKELKAMMRDGRYQALADKYRLRVTPASEKSLPDN